MIVCRLIRDLPLLGNIEYGLAPGIFAMSRAQAEMGCKIHLVARGKRRDLESEKGHNLQVHRVGFPYNLSSVKKISELDKRFGVDVIHAHATSALLFAFLNKFAYEKPYVIHVHDTTIGAWESFKHVDIKSSYLDLIEDQFWTWITIIRQKLMWKKADKLIAVSQSVAEELCDYYGVQADKIRVVHNGVDIDFFRPTDRKEKMRKRRNLGIDGDPLILYVGHLGARKGPHYLLKSIPKIIERFPNSVTVFVGGTPSFIGRRNYLQMWEELVSKLNIHRNVIFAGEVKHTKVLDFYNSADLFVLPTIYEGLPKSVLEAMACGLPVVTTSVSGNPEAVIHGKTGILVRPRNVSGLTKAIIYLLSNPSEAESIGKRGRKRVENDFTWKQAARKILDVYEEVK